MWRGAPRSDRWFYAGDALLVPFSVMWGGFTIFWEASAISDGAGPFFYLWGIPFVFVGLYIIVGRLLVRRRIRRQTQYVVTDRRVISLTPTLRGGRRVTSVWFASYPPVERNVRANGEGTITIGTVPAGQRWVAADASWPGGGKGSSAVVLADIPDAEQVYRQIVARLGPKGV